MTQRQPELSWRRSSAIDPANMKNDFRAAAGTGVLVRTRTAYDHRRRIVVGMTTRWLLISDLPLWHFTPPPSTWSYDRGLAVAADRVRAQCAPPRAHSTVPAGPAARYRCDPSADQADYWSPRYLSRHGRA